MDAIEQAKHRFIQTMRDLYPDNDLVQQTANEAEDDDLKNIVNAMIMGISSHPEYDDLIPALQEAMNALRAIYPDTNDSAEKTIMAYRSLFSSPNCLPPVIQKGDEPPSQFANRVVRHAQEWTS